jgi:diadenosine tetraphosphate (Ap4A) HIT family hydrolase
MADRILNKHAQCGALHVHVAAIPRTEDDWEWFAFTRSNERTTGGTTRLGREAAMREAERAYNNGETLPWEDIGPERSE